MLSNSSRSLENNVSCFRFPVFQTDNIPELIVVFNSTVNFPLSVLTIVGNALVLVAVWRTPSLRSPSVILLCGLATTDLAVGLLVQPLFLSMELTLLSNSSAYNCVLGKAFNTSSYHCLWSFPGDSYSYHYRQATSAKISYEVQQYHDHTASILCHRSELVVKWFSGKSYTMDFKVIVSFCHGFSRGHFSLLFNIRAHKYLLYNPSPQTTNSRTNKSSSG